MRAELWFEHFNPCGVHAAATSKKAWKPEKDALDLLRACRDCKQRTLEAVRLYARVAASKLRPSPPRPVYATSPSTYRATAENAKRKRPPLADSDLNPWLAVWIENVAQWPKKRRRRAA
jgi:hypothetical protein